MAFRIATTSPIVLRIAMRTVLLGVLAFMVAYLLATTNLYATALVVTLLGVVVLADLARTVSRPYRSLEHFLEGLAAGTTETPVPTLGGPSRLVASMGKTAAALDAARTERERRIAYLQTLLDTVAAALIVVRADGLVSPANRAAQSLTGAPAHRLEDIAAIGLPTARLLASLAPGARQIVPLADGRQVLATVSEFVIPGENKQRLIALQRISGELDPVEQKAWQDMARVLAHEMMNSLTPISSLAESLEGLLKNASENKGRDVGAASDDVAGAIDAIKRRSLGLMNFVNRYREFSDLPQPEYKSIRMDAFVAGLEQLMTAGFAAKGISYRTRIDPPELSLAADPELLEQAIINLLRNATDAVAGRADAAIELSCCVEGGRVAIAVTDNGPGFPEKGADQLFVPFFTTKTGGSGIGLSLARQITLAHGGQLEVLANHPSGAVFKISLPFERFSK